LKSLAGVRFNPAEASILLAAPLPVAVSSHTYSALGLVKIGRVGPDWRRTVTRTRLGDRLVTGRQEELTTLAAEAPKIATPVGNRCVKWGNEHRKP
jgi:hypothetical protein